MAFSFFLPVCCRVSQCARRELGVSYTADLVVQVLQPPFGNKVALQFSVQISYARGGSI
jgi:hypothetical protein